MLLSPSSLRWFAAGALISSTAWAAAFHVVLATGTASQMSGDLAERRTASELRRLRRRGWRIVNTVRLRRGTSDIDHVALGAGGLFAFETRWIGTSGTNRKILDARVRDAVAQVTEAENRLRLMFLEDVPANARQRVVVLWGPGSETWDEPVAVGGAVVLNGRELRTWLDRQPTNLLSPAAVERCWVKLVDTVERRDRNTVELEGTGPKGLGEHVARLFGLALATVLGFGGSRGSIQPQAARSGSPRRLRGPVLRWNRGSAASQARAVQPLLDRRRCVREWPAIPSPGDRFSLISRRAPCSAFQSTR